MLANPRFKTAIIFLFGTFVLICNLLLWQFLAFQPGELHLIERDASWVYDTKGNLLFKIHQDAPKIQTHVELDQIPIACLQAIIATEDPTFMVNIGVDARGLVRGLLGELSGQNRGGSTISQQLVKVGQNNFYSRNPIEKILELTSAVRLNTQWSKQHILESYLNNVYFGNYHYGIGAAAKLYFSKSVRDLSASECTYLMGIPNRPAYLDPFMNPVAVRQRQLVVIQLMRQHGFISLKVEQTLIKKPIIISSDNAKQLPKLTEIIQKASQEIFRNSEKFRDINNASYIFILNLSSSATPVILESIVKL